MDPTLVTAQTEMLPTEYSTVDAHQKWEVRKPLPYKWGNAEADPLSNEKSISIHRNLVQKRGYNLGATYDNKTINRQPSTIQAKNFLKKILPANVTLERDLRK